MASAVNPTAGMTDKPYGRVTVLPHGWERRGPAWYVLCRCECGTEWLVCRASVRAGRTKSCGCYKREVSRASLTTHGLKGHPLYPVWQSMNRRCYDSSEKAYPDYGGRGITVCDRWRESVAAFIEDMGERPDGMTLERKDNHKGYEPGNCRWATRTEQGRNKRNSRFITHDGRTQTLAAWAEETGLRVSTILSRVDRLGWTVADALTTPSRG